MKTQHTSGPWLCDESNPEDRYRYVLSEVGIVCRLERGTGSEENARLIAAAPDLLGALERLVGVLEKQLASPHSAERASPIAQARAAIAKAIGT